MLSSCNSKPTADFLLVDKDVLTCPTAEIHTAKPAATYFEGKKVFEREKRRVKSEKFATALN